ncbi:MAG TPA: nucleotide sugar dehydrogenase [Opitutaceae bacterium]|nr:nucleotide sugar dehydrogenase [Opitutaceae bacterium]
MKLVVLGLWHLGCVTAACCARHFQVVGLDRDEANVAQLRTGRAPISEPGLDALLREGIDAGRLTFTTDAAAAAAGADLLWVAWDTPVDENDQADVERVLADVRAAAAHLAPGALVLVSSQLPVGTCARLEREFAARTIRVACSPENLRLGQALAIFQRPDRIVVGCRDDRSRAELAALFAPFAAPIVWMRPESAEMTKHAINAFLALSITFMNEVAQICEATGADAKEVEEGLKSESRIGPKAYLSPGGAFAGGTLARDVVTLTALAAREGRAVELLPAIKRSNDRHRGWALARLQALLPPSAGRTVALLGLTYKPGTDTLRRSSAVELARALGESGYAVRAFDPARPLLPPELGFVALASRPEEALDGADAVVVCTAWPEFRTWDWRELAGRLRSPLVLDANRFLEKNLAGAAGVRYIAVGTPA